MATIDTLVRDFLAQKTIAVVGVSDRRETGCNLAYRTFKMKGHRVYAVNPHISEYNGEACYPDLASIPEKPDAVFILARPAVAEDIVRQCVSLGIRRVWMHCAMGTKPGLAPGMTSVSDAAVRMCRENGIAVIPGSCPNQYIPSDIGHGLMRTLFRTLGLHRIDEPAEASR